MKITIHNLLYAFNGQPKYQFLQLMNVKPMFRNIGFLLLMSLFVLTESKANCWKFISSGKSHTLGIKTDGSLWAWGNNSAGQLGDGTKNNSLKPKRIGTGNDWKVISVGDSFSLALKTDGSLWTWGYSSTVYGIISPDLIYNLVPQRIGTDNDWKTIATGVNGALALKNDGSLWAWRNIPTGTICSTVGTFICRSTFGSTPTQIGIDKDWQSISTGGYHATALKTDGTLWGWADFFAKTTAIERFYCINTARSPVQLNADKWKSIASSRNHIVAINADGTLWVLGSNPQLYDFDGTNTCSLQQISTANWQSVATYGNHNLGIQSDGSLWSWGRNSLGQLGTGDNNDKVLTPVKIGSDKNWQTVVSGDNTSYAIKTDGTLWIWGDNSSGQFGDGTTTGTITPMLKELCTSLPCNLTPSVSGSNSVNIGATTNLTGSATTGTFVWSSSDITVATVSATGVVKGLKAGTVTISYKITEGTCTATATKTITVNGTTQTGFDPTKCYRIVNKATNKVLELKGASSAEGTQIYQWASATSRKQQLWQIKKRSDGRYNIVAKSTGKLMDAPDCAEGGIIKEFAADGTNSQNWAIEPQADGSYKILNQSCNKYIRVEGSNTADGHEVGIKNDFGADSFKWFFKEADCTTGATLSATADAFGFEARASEGRAKLQWITNTGDKTDYFTVERLNPQGSFDVLDRQNAFATNDTKYYTFTDNDPLDGDNFYRINSVFQNAPPQYSEIKKISFSKNEGLNIYPNPANDYITVDLRQYEGKAVSLYLYNSVGLLLKKAHFEKATAAPQRIDIEGFTTGSYLMRVQSEGKREVTRLFNIAK